MLLLPRDPRLTLGIEDLGRSLARARSRRGMSQRGLARLSGVSQSVISRAERALAPRLGLERVISLKVVLGVAWPLGWCPHHHVCEWQPPGLRGDRPTAPQELPAEMRAKWLGPSGAEDATTASNGDPVAPDPSTQPWSPPR